MNVPRPRSSRLPVAAGPLTPRATRERGSRRTRERAGAGLAGLRADLASGRWAARNRHLLALDAGYRLVRCELAGQVN